MALRGRAWSSRKLSFLFVALSLTQTPAWSQNPAPSDSEVESRVDSILGQMTNEEKIDLLSGINFFDVRGIPRLNLPVTSTADGPIGVRNDGPATVMAGGISLAATWNTDLARQVGQEIGRDARAKGKSFLLGPGVNIYRSPLNGRNFEYFGEDPFLASRIAVGYIEGVQAEGVSATVKHFLGNNSEFGRNTTDSVIDERTLREIYLPTFEAAVKEARVGAIMDSYNLTNGEYMTQNGYLNNEVVKKEWGFQGIVMSDWGATHDTLGAFNGGLDLEMWSGQFLNRGALLPALQQGKIAQATLDDKVRRILRTEVKLRWLDRPQLDPSVPRYNQQGRQVALQAAREGIVLLKNEGNILPLNKNKVKTVAVIGPDAYPAVPVGGGSAQAAPFRAVSFLEGISDHLGPATSVTYARGLPTLGMVANRTSFSTAETDGKPGLTAEVFDTQDLSGTPASTRVDQHINLGSAIDLNALSSGEIDLSALGRPRPNFIRWTGYYVPENAGTYDFFVQQGGFGDSGFRLYVDGALVRDRWNFDIAIVDWLGLTLTASPHKIVIEYHSGAGFLSPRFRVGIMREGSWVEDAAKTLAGKADVVIVAAGFNPESESEGWDRTFALPPGQDELIQEIAVLNKKTIVAVTSGGGVGMRSWIDKIPGLLQAWYPGQEGGTALAEILFGETNPSGHLPATFEKQWDDNPAHNNYYPATGSNKIEYKEGVFVGYRGYEQNHTQPQFPFGFGLSYTTFKYADLAVKPAPGGLGDYQVSFDVTNTGKLAGAAVAQLYISDGHAAVPRPPKELKGFAKVFLKPGETRNLSIPLNPRSFSYYDTNAKQWHAHSGTYGVLVGSSSADIALRGDAALAQDVLSK
jgi:beta-glucosidase